MRDFDGSQVLYRLAFASGMRAAQRRAQAYDCGNDIERSARSFDASVEAVVLMQASAEAWINRQFDLAGLSGRGWRSRWNGLGRLAEHLGRPRNGLSNESKRLLDDIETIRNFLMHGDTHAKRRLEEWSGGRDLHDIVTVEFVEQMFQRAEALWREARDITGLSTPGSDGAWVASDEFM